MSEFKILNPRKLPGSWLIGLSFIIGVAVYLFSIVVKQPTLGIFLGFATWLILIRLANQFATKQVIRYTDELFTQNRSAEAMEYLKALLERFKGPKGVRQYYEEKVRTLHPVQYKEAAVASVQPLELDHLNDSSTIEDLETSPEPDRLVIEKESVKLSFRGVLILICLPFVFLPVSRQTFPHLGLWPAVIMLVAGFPLFVASTNKWDKMVAKLGIGLALLSFALFGFSLLANEIPGLRPGFKLDFKSSKTDWVIKMFGFVVLMFSVVLHETAHAFAAFFSGDSTAKDQGRITLNPVKHIELFGTIILPALMFFLPGGVVFGWAKPVEYNPSNFRNYRRGQLAVSISGVAVNLLLAFFSCCMLMTSGILLHRWYPGMSAAHFASPWTQVALTGVPAPGIWMVLIELFKSGVVINMTLFSLNILPVPPLDGYGVLEGLVFRKLREWMGKARKWGSLVFIGLIFTHILDYLLIPGLLIAMGLLALAGNLAKLG